MSDHQTTRPSLLLRIRDVQDVQAWTQFAEIYAPLIIRFGRKNGLQDADANDLAQEVLSSLAKSIGKFDYDSKIGRFRSWLFKVSRNKMNTYLHKRSRQPRASGDTNVQRALANVADGNPDLEQAWEDEYEQHLFRWASDQVKGHFTESTWGAFWQTAVENKPAGEVAEALGMTTGAVYIAKSRVMAKLKEQIEQVDDR